MAVIATAGHVDHGKSSLIAALTGTDPDRLAEEKQRGMTIDLGFAHATTPSGVVLSFVDVPGHVDFIRNMIAGVAEVSAVLLVVDAAEGWMPQTAEHCDIVSLLGVTEVVVAVTKADRVTPEQVQDVISEVTDHLSEMNLPIRKVVITSVVTKVGLEELRTVLEILVQQFENNQTAHSRTRLYVDRVFTMAGSGTVVTGTLQGNVRNDQRLHIVRSGREVRVRSIQIHGKKVDHLWGPNRCALNLTGVEVDDLERGDALVVDSEWSPTTTCDVQLQVIQALGHSVNKRGHFILHVGSSDQEVRLRVVNAENIAPGASGLARLSFAVPLPLLPGDRFVLRETGRNETVGGGVVLDAHPVASITKARPDGTLETYLAERGWMKVSDVIRDTGMLCEPTVGEWVASNALATETLERLHQKLNSAPEGLDVTHLEPWELSLAEQFDDVVIGHGFVRKGDQLSSDEQRVLDLIRAGGVKGEEAHMLSRDVVRRLTQRGLVFEHDHIVFHVDVLENLRINLEKLWQQFPDGFTMAQLRDELAITRKTAVPLGTVLDKYGLTKRLGDLRVAGPRWIR